MRTRGMGSFSSLWFILLIIAFFCVSGFAAERKKPLPLEDLQNPKSSSYVPAPYPQTDDEVLADLSYFMKRSVLHSLQAKMNGNSNSNIDFETICLDFMNDKGIIVGEIVKVKNELSGRERDYAFLVRLKNKENYAVASFGILANGIVAQWSYIDLKDLSEAGSRLKELVFRPLLDKLAVKEEIVKAIGYELDAEELNGLNLVEGSSLVGDLTCPAVEVRLKDGRVFYKSHTLHALYQWIEKTDHDDLGFGQMGDSDNQFIEQSTIDRLIILKKIFNEN